MRLAHSLFILLLPFFRLFWLSSSFCQHYVRVLIWQQICRAKRSSFNCRAFPRLCCRRRRFLVCPDRLVVVVTVCVISNFLSLSFFLQHFLYCFKHIYIWTVVLHATSDPFQLQIFILCTCSNLFFCHVLFKLFYVSIFLLPSGVNIFVFSFVRFLCVFIHFRSYFPFECLSFLFYMVLYTNVE